jgi:hypothetical protein
MAFTAFMPVKASPAVANPLVFKNVLREIIVINKLKYIEAVKVKKNIQINKTLNLLKIEHPFYISFSM